MTCHELIQFHAGLGQTLSGRQMPVAKAGRCRLGKSPKWRLLALMDKKHYKQFKLYKMLLDSPDKDVSLVKFLPAYLIRKF